MKITRSDYVPDYPQLLALRRRYNQIRAHFANESFNVLHASCRRRAQHNWNADYARRNVPYDTMWLSCSSSAGIIHDCQVIFITL